MLGKEHIRMAKFALVGFLNTGVDFAVFMVLVYVLGLTSAWAQLVSYSAGVLNSYWWNRKWTFRAAGQANWKEGVRFVVVNGLSFAAATAALLSLERGIGWQPVWAKAVSVIVSMAVNYAGSRYWVFGMETRPDRAR